MNAAWILDFQLRAALAEQYDGFRENEATGGAGR